MILHTNSTLRSAVGFGLSAWVRDEQSAGLHWMPRYHQQGSSEKTGRVRAAHSVQDA